MPEPLPDLTTPVPVGVTYTSRPSTITAGQWTGDNLEQIKAWVGNDNLDHWVSGIALTLWVEANTSWLPLEAGEWIIKDDLGFYPCKDSVFRKKYQRAAVEDELAALKKQMGYGPTAPHILIQNGQDVG